MTTNLPAPARRRLPKGLVGTTVSKHITGLQRGYLDDRSAAVATLARLRRGVGRPAGEMPDLWGFTGTEPLYEACAQGTFPDDLMVQAEEAAYVALTLWSLHQQSQHVSRMHVPGGLELGAAVRRLMPGAEPDEPIRKRFVRAATASSPTILAQRLRDIVVLLRRAEIALDYGLLADQLLRWQEPGGPDQVRRSWGRAFHADRATVKGTPGDPDGGGADDSDAPDGGGADSGGPTPDHPGGSGTSGTRGTSDVPDVPNVP